MSKRSSHPGVLGEAWSVVKATATDWIDDDAPRIAAALAYYGFLAIPASLMVALGVFSIVADPSAVQTLLDKVGTVIPGEAKSLLEDSLTRMTEQSSGGWALQRWPASMRSGIWR